MTLAGSTRIVALDAVRGMAVLGILLLNIVDFAMPRYAYVDPTFYGGASGADWWAWALSFIVADGKMRGLFSMLFGASTLLVAERAQAAGDSPFRVHMARMTVLFLIGMVHAYLIWSGDILVLYALCGVLAFAFREARMSTLLAIASNSRVSPRTTPTPVSSHDVSKPSTSGWSALMRPLRPGSGA